MTSDFRIAPVNQEPDLLERLAGVPAGTYPQYRQAIAEMSNVDMSEMSSREIEAAVAEQFNELRAQRPLRTIAEFLRDWFGEITPASLRLLETWGVYTNGRILPTCLRDETYVRALLHAQGILLPDDLTIDDLGGLQIGHRATLSSRTAIVR